MKLAHYAAIPLGLMLLLSTGFVSYNNVFAQVNLTQTKMATETTIDDVPKIVRPGKQVTLTGSVMSGDGEPLQDATVNIYLLTSAPKLIVVASGITGIEGTFEIVWDVKLIPQERALTDVTRKVDTQVGSLFAQFEGDDTFAPSKSAKSTVTIEVNSIKTFVSSDKKEYNEGDTATIFIGFVDADDEFVDPDSINANFNLTPIGDQLEQKKAGSYAYVTPPLQRGHNQVTIVPAKEGYNIEAEAVTITVLSKGSVGKFQFQ
jgi:hypothetical protein